MPDYEVEFIIVGKKSCTSLSRIVFWLTQFDFMRVVGQNVLNIKIIINNNFIIFIFFKINVYLKYL